LTTLIYKRLPQKLVPWYRGAKGGDMRAIFPLVLIITLLALTGGSARAQQPKKIPRIGILSPGSGNPAIDAFRQGLQELGWVEGENIAIEYRWAEGNEDRLWALADELLRTNVDIIVATSARGAHAAHRLTKTTPIVTTGASDPVGSGLVKSLGQPEGNLTGLSSRALELGGKRLELLKEIIPGTSRVAVLAHVVNIDWETSIKEIEAVAQSLGVQLQILNVKTPDEIPNAFSAMLGRKAGALTRADAIHVPAARNKDS
jgi:putative tryptophan/tyrosine transport system substrate-binding protein